VLEEQLLVGALEQVRVGARGRRPAEVLDDLGDRSGGWWGAETGGHDATQQSIVPDPAARIAPCRVHGRREDALLATDDIEEREPSRAVGHGEGREHPPIGRKLHVIEPSPATGPPLDSPISRLHCYADHLHVLDERFYARGVRLRVEAVAGKAQAGPCQSLELDHGLPEQQGHVAGSGMKDHLRGRRSREQTNDPGARLPVALRHKTIGRPIGQSRKGAEDLPSDRCGREEPGGR
jgi:hypothetical protein